MRILVLNGGSSTLKTAVIDTATGETTALRTDPWDGDRQAIARRVIGELSELAIEAVGHRVVHGGTKFVEPVLVDDAVLDELHAMGDFAPLHNRVAVELVRVARGALPDVPNVCCFDTGFHATLTEAARRYPVPEAWAAWGIRRFGFHGLSVEWSVSRAAELLGGRPESISLVVAHLGSGCSVTAVRKGRSAWTSMGFTPLEGLMMGSRSGSIDPGIIIFLLRSGRIQLSDLEDALERRSGLLGISGVSADMQDVRVASDAGNAQATLAVDMFVARAAEAIAAAMTWVSTEAIVFTGGIGEHDGRTRDAICARLGSGWGTKAAPVLVIQAREDLVIANAAASLLTGGRD